MVLLQRGTRNILQMAFGMMMTFIASMCHSFIAETVTENRNKEDPDAISKHAGYYAACMLYAASLISNVVAPPLVHILGLRVSMFLGGFFYAIYMAAFFHLTNWLLYTVAIMDGLISGIMWTAVGQYLSLNSDEKTINRKSSVMYMIILTGTLWGGSFLLAMFGSKDNRDITESTQYILYGAFTTVSLIGGVILLCLPQPEKAVAKSDAKTANLWSEIPEELAKSFRLVITFDFLLIAIPSAYTGVELSYWTGVYPTSLSFTKKFTINTNVMIALNCICVGLGEMLGGLIFGLFGERSAKIGRSQFMWLGSILGIIAYGIAWFNIPGPAAFEETHETSIIHPNVALALIVGFLLGFCDCCINSMIYAYIAVQFEGKIKQAYALSKFFHSAMGAVCLFYGAKFSTQVQLSILLIGTVVSSISFTIGERRFKSKLHSIQSTTKQPAPSISISESQTSWK